MKPAVGPGSRAVARRGSEFGVVCWGPLGHEASFFSCLPPSRFRNGGWAIARLADTPHQTADWFLTRAQS